MNTMTLGIKEIIIIMISVIAGILITFGFINQNFSHVSYAVGSTQGYDFNKPSASVELPKILYEVSGLTTIDDNTLALVQDEDGIVFIYSWEKKEIIRRIKFAGPGDYEGVTRVDNNIYVLRSDGKLYEIENFESEDFKVKEHKTNIPVKNNEGLVYDAAHNRLLIAGKSKPKGDAYKKSRAVFAFDLTTKSLEEQPIYIFSEENINQFVRENNNASSRHKSEPDLKINPSAIAIHPNTGRLFVLSSRDKLIYIFNQENELEAVHHLDKKIHTQPEGITFLENGDMFISNEGATGVPTLHQLLYKQQY